MGRVIANYQLPISDWRLAIVPIGNRQSEIGNVGTHPLPRTVLTSRHSVASNQSASIAAKELPCQNRVD
ncbi:MAG TPA: hypothetical protein DC047_10655 [Blastocatellia bacterium]|nr:hypothetical protein [Blastocatellia bacterium]